MKYYTKSDKKNTFAAFLRPTSIVFSIIIVGSLIVRKNSLRKTTLCENCTIRDLINIGEKPHNCELQKKYNYKYMHAKIHTMRIV